MMYLLRKYCGSLRSEFVLFGRRDSQCESESDDADPIRTDSSVLCPKIVLYSNVGREQAPALRYENKCLLNEKTIILQRRFIMFRCKKCNHEIQYIQQKPAGTFVLLCPVCGEVITAESEYGFGPVWPACFYYGNSLIAEFYHTEQGDDFELKIMDIVVPFELSPQLKQENYKRHMEICGLIINLLKDIRKNETQR